MSPIFKANAGFVDLVPGFNRETLKDEVTEYGISVTTVSRIVQQ